jgi:hypothetical protein
MVESAFRPDAHATGVRPFYFVLLTTSRIAGRLFRTPLPSLKRSYLRACGRPRGAR